MKKKGLIIATIVMVLVLAVSLTTATYAWFSTSASTVVEQISVNIDAASDIDIGVAAYNKYASDTANDYYYETITTTAASNKNQFTVSGTRGLGSSLSISSFDLGTSVGTADFADETALHALTASDSDFDRSHNIFAATVNDEATGYSIDDKGSAKFTNATYAEANEDYINLVLGARSNKKNSAVGIVCKVVVKTTGAALTLQMDAAFHLAILTGGDKTSGAANYLDIDVFSGEYSDEVMKYTTNKADVASYTSTVENVVYSVENDQAVATFYFLVAGSKTVPAQNPTYLTTTAINPLQIYGFVWGEDEDCVTSATGCGCTLDIEFIAVNSSNLAKDPSSGGLKNITYVSIPAIQTNP